MSQVNTEGKFYEHFLSSAEFPYTEEEKLCITETVIKLRDEETRGSKPGMLLGKIQSGKTKTFMAIMGLAFDNDYDIAVVLTKGTKALAKQTQLRIKSDFMPFISDDDLEIFDIMNMPERLTKWELQKKIVIIVKKQKDNLARLLALYANQEYLFKDKMSLIIDDEADYASVGYNKKEGELSANLTACELDKLRKSTSKISFLQVTATPYSLYLQPEDIEVNGDLFKPLRPAFTSLVPVNKAYVGSDYYFEEIDDADSPASLLHHKLNTKELLSLRKKDQRKIKLDEVLDSNNIKGLRKAIVNFVVAGAIRSLQTDGKARKLSFLIHTEVAKAAHSWQKEVVDAILLALVEESELGSELFIQLVSEAYEELAKSIILSAGNLPEQLNVIKKVEQILMEDHLLVVSVNSEQQVESMLDDSGQLKLRAPLNIFIGGQILDRGITIGNLIGFYYGRKPNSFQQDTVLQHCRMFGYRPKDDLAVTRFYTEQTIYNAMKKMHESDVALREQFENNPDQGVAFILGTTSGQVRPCSPNKIMLSKTTTLKPYKRLIPVGFQTSSKTITNKITKEIDSLLESIQPSGPSKTPFSIKMKDALKVIDLLSECLKMSEEEGYSFDWNSMKNAITYMTKYSQNDEIKCLWLTGRKNKRLAGEGSHTKYVATPDTAKTEGATAREYGKTKPVLTLFKQEGAEEQGWRGAEFYWPLLYAAGNIPVTIYSDESNSY
ncbi:MULTISPECIES: Z1 domain-containing protein [Pseudoalteromonas]|uniref:Z1 domain-containing protein n=1 Tax=Pseudoalteromonas TaxID=53246 RepID=UPI00165FD971|nr:MULTISPECIES: Z1 domain-containing protein [Pseudoalteromonas]MBD0412957.1 DEAD/DEAH box helicase family protein [Pseudoalteromonas distincta]